MKDYDGENNKKYPSRPDHLSTGHRTRNYNENKLWAGKISGSEIYVCSQSQGNINLHQSPFKG